MMKPNDPLLHAINRGEIKEVKQWIENGNDVNVDIEETNCSLIAFAVSAGFCEIVDMLAAAGANLFEITEYSSLYKIPTHRGQIDIVQVLINRGLDVNITDHEGNPPLYYAAFYKQEKIAELLIKNGANEHLANKQNISPHLIFNYFDSIQILQNRETIQFSPMALSLALQHGEEHLIRRWVKEGIDLNGTNSLHDAAFFGQQAIVEYLLSLKLNVDLQGRDGETPLHKAVKTKRENIVQTLLIAGSNINLLSNTGKTAYFLSIQLNHNSIKSLFEQYHVPSKPDWQAYTNRVKFQTLAQLNSSSHDFETIYRSISNQRQQYQLSIQPFDQNSLNFGQFCEDDKFSYEIFTRCNSAFSDESKHILNWLIAITETFQHNPGIASPFLKIRSIENIPAELDNINKTAKELISIPFQKTPAKIFEIIFVNTSVELTKFYFFQYPDRNNNAAIMIYPYKNKQAMLPVYFETANIYFQLALNQQTPENFLKNVSLLMHFMALVLPVKRGNASNLEMITEGLAASKGWKINQLNKPPAKEELTWDLKAFITPDPLAYSKWFVNAFKDNLILNENTDPRYSIAKLPLFWQTGAIASGGVLQSQTISKASYSSCILQ